VVAEILPFAFLLYQFGVWWSPACATDLWCVFLLFYDAKPFFWQYMLLNCAATNNNCLLYLLQAATFFDLVADIILQECLFYMALSFC